MVSLGLRTLPVVGLLALVPVLAYTLTRDVVVSLSVVSVLVIGASLYVMFLPSEKEVRSAGVDSDAESADSFGQ
jgi:uncharacterized membrane protein YukC